MLRYVILALSLLVAAPAAATEAGWALLRDGGHVVLLRHADAPGVGDPANFDIAKCATQRNLSDRGRQQARRIGALFAARAAPVEKVLTSDFCRCADTARLAFGDRIVEALPALDFLPDDEAGNAAKVAEVQALIRDYSDTPNLVMVVNDDVVQGVLGIATRDGEAIIVGRDGETLRVAGRVRFN